MLLRPSLNDRGSCAGYLFGCTTHNRLAVVDPHADLVDAYLAAASAIGSEIVAVFETHVQADHVSGLPTPVGRTGATPYLPANSDVEFVAGSLEPADYSSMPLMAAATRTPTSASTVIPKKKDERGMPCPTRS